MNNILYNSKNQTASLLRVKFNFNQLDLYKAFDNHSKK